MEISTDIRLFWFTNAGAKINLNDNFQKDTYVQQILSNGNTGDIKNLLQMLKLSDIKDSFVRIKRFLPKEVVFFWEDLFGNFK